MSRIILARTRPDGTVMESFEAADRVDCTTADGSEEAYEIVPEEHLGDGGNAIVYGCRSVSSGESFAIKIQINTRQKRLQRFKREERLLETLHHDQLMTCVGHGDISLKSKGNGEKIHPFIIMPMADKNLLDLVKASSNPIAFDWMAGQFRALSEALAVLHKHAIHRDIKPENILIRGETWILSDYGLCRFLDPDDNGSDITMDDEKVGPVFWMSPESMNKTLGNGDEITKASDVFQLASVFWFAATGRHPTGIVKVTDWGGPPKVFEVLSAALSHDPAQRPSDGKAFHEQIKAALLDA